MSLPLLVDARDFTSPVALSATADGVYTAKRLPIPTACVCTDGSCLRCHLDDDAAFERRVDE